MRCLLHDPTLPDPIQVFSALIQGTTIPRSHAVESPDEVVVQEAVGETVEVGETEEERLAKLNREKVSYLGEGPKMLARAFKWCGRKIRKLKGKKRGVQAETVEET